jgi:hypothetical protein
MNEQGISITQPAANAAVRSIFIDEKAGLELPCHASPGWIATRTWMEGT